MVYANRVVPSLERGSARAPAYYVAALPAAIAAALTVARLVGFTTGSLRNDIVLIAATAAVACSWGPIVRGAMSLTGGATAIRDERLSGQTDVAGSRINVARTAGYAVGVGLFIVTMTAFTVPAAASFYACLDTERILADAEPPAENTAPIEDAFPYNPPEHGAQFMLDFPMALELAASSRSDPSAREQLIAADFVGAHVRSWIAEDSSWIEAEVMEFAAAEGAATYQGQVHRYACGYANEAFEAPLGGIGLQVRYEHGAPYVEQISWVAGNRRYKVQISAYHRPTDHARVIAIQAAVTGSWPTAPPPAVAEPLDSPAPDASVGPGAFDEVRAAVEATIAEGTVHINKHVQFAGSTEIPDGATATAGGMVSLEERRMRVLVGFADTAADLEDSLMTVILDDTALYLRGQVLHPLVRDGRWLLVDLDSGDVDADPFKALVAGHNDASMAMFYLYGVTHVASVRDDIVHEQPASVYWVEIDLETALDAVPPEHADGLRSNILALRAAGVHTDLQAEIWVAQDGLVHHIDYDQELGAEMGGGSMSTSVSLFDFGEPLDLEIPEPQLVIPVEDVKVPTERLPRA
jgi:hypothetical protein